MSAQLSYPTELQATTDEKKRVLYEYGQAGLYAGFRDETPPPSQAHLINGGLFTDCGINTSTMEPLQKASKAEYFEQCHGFQVDFYAAPLWMPFRMEPIDDLPPR